MQFSRKTTNKLVSYVDRYFTWDSRKMKREGDFTDFDLVAFNHDNGVTVVFIKHSKHGIWATINKDGNQITSGYLKTYKEINAFKKMVRCLG